HGHAGVRIHDVRVAHAAGLERLLRAACHRDGAVLQLNGERGLSGVDWILNRDWPSVTFGGRAERVDGAASGTDESRRDAPPLQQSDDAIDGVAFGDATQIELHAGRVEG